MNWQTWVFILVLGGVLIANRKFIIAELKDRLEFEKEVREVRKLSLRKARLEEAKNIKPKEKELSNIERLVYGK